MQNNFESLPQACLGNENDRKISRRMHYFKNTYLHIHSRLLPDYSRPKSRRHNLLVYTRHRDTWIHYNRTQLKKKPNNVWLKHNIIYFFNIFSNITGLTNSYHPSCYRHISDRNSYTTSLLLISLVLLSEFRQEYLHYISTYYLIGFIITYHIISHPSYHLPILRVLSYTNFSHRCYHLVSHALPNPNCMYSSIIIIKCRYHMTFRRNHSSSPLVFSGVRVAQSLVFYVVFCRSLFVRLSFFHVSHCIYCLSLFNWRLLITPFVSSNSNSLMLSSHITWITTSYFIRVIIWCHVTYHILFHRSYHLISRDLPHPISSELSSQSLSPSHLYEPGIQ
jgi:hypothetical protein